MARKAAPSTLIHCDSCGEDYSSTYKRCPFCGERPDKGTTTRIPPVTEPPISEEDDGYVFDGGDVFDDAPASHRPAQNRGGKRLEAGSAPGPINWPRVITFLCSIVIIIAALVIVFVYIYPKIHSGSSGPSESPSPGISSQAPETQSPAPSDQPSDQPSVSPSDEPSTEPSQQPSAAPNTVTGLSLNKTDFTLTANESFTIQATVSPASWSGSVTWKSSNESVATVDSNGTVTNTNTGSKLLSVTITATAGDKTATAKVYCRGGSSGTAAPSASPSSGTLKLNREDFSLTIGTDATFRMKATGVDSVVWSIKDASIATIDSSGLVTAVSRGSTTITATAPDGQTATCIVRVRAG